VFETNEVNENTDAGVLFDDDAGGSFTGNTLVDNPNISIQVSGSAAPTIEDNVLDGPGKIGVLYVKDGAGRFADNELSGFEVGVQAADDALPEIDSNTFAEITTTSILFGGNARGVITKNVCPSGVVGKGIRIVSPANPTLSANQCSITQSG
jgi:hypothetical protein